MSVSPVDPSTTPPTLRVLDRLHQLELHADDTTAVSQALLELRCQQLALAEASLQRLTPHEAGRLRQNLGTPTTLSEEEVAHLQADAHQLEGAFEQLSANYDLMLKEMATLAWAVLKNSAVYTGREQQEELRDALRLLRGIQEHPIGSRNFAVWFELGWALWMLGEPLAQAQEAFYQAARLSGNTGSLYHTHALRHLAHLQAAEGKWQEARETLKRVPQETQESEPGLWLEAARYGLLSGQAQESQRLLERALDHQPELAFAVLADQDLAPLYPTCLHLVDHFTVVTRNAATQALTHYHVAQGAADYLKAHFEISITLPETAALPHTAESASLFEAKALLSQAQRETVNLLLEASQRVEKARKEAQESARRLKVQIDQAVSEKSYYEGSLKNIEEHAKESGFSLHPYNFNNPFLRKRNQKAEEARFAYESFKQKLAQAETYLQDHLPAMESALSKQQSRVEKAEQALEWLQSQRN